MNTRRSILAFPSLLLAVIAITGGVRAGVSTESPFTPRGQTAAAAVANNTPIELRGITSDSQGMRFAIYDPVKKEGTWVRIDEKDHSFVVRSYDEATNRIVVDYQGKSQTIVLVEPKFGPGKSVAPMVAMPGVPAQPIAAVAQPVQGRFARPDGGQPRAEPSADEAKRLEAIRAEVARRRAQREAAAQPQPQQQ